MTTEPRVWDSFSRFCNAELASGGPDPQVLLAARAAQRWPLRSQQLAFAGCFVGPYTCGAAGPLFKWLYENEGSLFSDFTDYVSTNWDGLPRRRERRAIDKRSGEKLTDCIRSWLTLAPALDPAAPYPVLYGWVRKEAKFFGRYATMKVLEVLKQADLIEHGQDSICPAGAKYPRRTLAQLWPSEAEVLTSKSDSRDVLLLCNGLATATKSMLEQHIDQPVSWFQFETLLCNFRQALKGKYPGRSHDRELAHFRKAEAYWGADELHRWFPFFDLRERLFPHVYLGEFGGWDGARKELEVPWV